MDTRWLDAETDREIRDLAQRAVVVASEARSLIALSFGIAAPDVMDTDRADAAVPHAREARERFVAERLVTYRAVGKPHLASDLLRGVKSEDFGHELDIARAHMRDVGVPERLAFPPSSMLDPSYSKRQEREGARTIADSAAWSVSELNTGLELAQRTLGVSPYERSEYGPRGLVAQLMFVQLPAHLELAGVPQDIELPRVRDEVNATRDLVVRGDRLEGIDRNIAVTRELANWIKPHLAYGGADFIGLDRSTSPGLDNEGRRMIEATLEVGRQSASAERLREGMDMTVWSALSPAHRASLEFSVQR